jgi:peptide/nickel transport system permease protein
LIAYIIRRLIIAVLVTIGIAVVTFLLLRLAFPSPAVAALGTKARPAEIAVWDRTHGYDRPIYVQIASYVWNIFHFNFGYSYRLSQSVSALFKENAGRSAYLSGAALVLSLIIAIPLGVWQAVRRNSLMDYTMTAWNFTLYSMPSFFLGLILIQIFALDLNVLPPEVSSTITSTWGAISHPTQLLLPIVTLALINVASFSRYMRSSALDVLAEDYVRLARAKGLRERMVLTRHLLRNACLPIITLLGLSIPSLLAGNLLIEYLFNDPGLGLLFYNGLLDQDYNLLLAYTILGGFLTVLGNLMADVVMTISDPRIRLD